MNYISYLNKKVLKLKVHLTVTTFSMIKTLCYLCLLVCGLSVYAQNTCYYKLSSVNHNGSTNKSMSGGQFVTFINNICFESTKEGDGVGHGSLSLNKQKSNRL